MQTLTLLRNKLPQSILTWNALRKILDSNGNFNSYDGYYIFRDYEAKTETTIDVDFLRARCFEEIIKTKVVGNDFLDIKSMLNPYVGTPEKHEQLREKLMKLSRLI